MASEKVSKSRKSRCRQKEKEYVTFGDLAEALSTGSDKPHVSVAMASVRRMKSRLRRLRQKADREVSKKAGRETWRRVRPVAKDEAARLASSHTELVDFLASRFRETFGVSVEKASLKSFPAGRVVVTLVADVLPYPMYNVWGLAISLALAKAGVTVSVIVRASEEPDKSCPLK